MSKLKNIREQFFFGSLILVVITLSLSKYSLNTQSIIVYAICWLFYGSFKEKYQNLKKNFLPFLLMSFLFWISLIGLLYTENITYGLRNFQMQIPFLAFPLIFFSVEITKKTKFILLKYFSFGVVVSATFALLKASYFKVNNFGDYFYYDKLGLLLDIHTTYFAMYVIIALLFFGSYISQKGIKQKLIYGVCIIFLLWFLYLLSVRVSVVALLVGGLLLIFSNRKSLKPKSFLLVLGGVLIMTLFYFTPNFQKRFNAKTPEGIAISDVDTRSVHWQSALEVIGQNNLFFGSGTGDGHAKLYDQYLKNGFETGYIYQYNAHNQFLEITLYFGLLGLLLLLAIIFFVLKKCYVQQNYLGIAILAVQVIVMITESTLESQSGIVPFAFTIAILSLPLAHSEKRNKLKKNILFMGPYSAVGGVSVHIKRLSNLLEDKCDVSFVDESPLEYSKGEVFNLRSKNIFKYLKLVTNADVIHIHSGVSVLRIFHIIMAFMYGKRSIVTYHTIYNLPSKTAIFINRLFLPFANKVICVTEEISTILKPKNGRVLPAFVPPLIDSEPELPEIVKAVIEKNRGKKLITSNAFRLDIHQETDLYGMDLLLDVARKIKTENLDYKIIFIVADSNDEAGLFNKYVEIIKAENLESEISLLPKPISFVKLMLQSDVVIRPTASDGDALTVREALFLNKPIIASDVTVRPEGTILFENRNSSDLFQKIKETLESSINNTFASEVVSKKDNSFYLKTYGEIYESK